MMFEMFLILRSWINFFVFYCLWFIGNVDEMFWFNIWNVLFSCLFVNKTYGNLISYCFRKCLLSFKFFAYKTIEKLWRPFVFQKSFLDFPIRETFENSAQRYLLENALKVSESHSSFFVCSNSQCSTRNYLFDTTFF